MKVAVSSQGPNLDSRVDSRFGRARCFVVVDTESGELSIWNNGDRRCTSHTAGMQAAGALVSLGAIAVITDKIGPKAFDTLQAAKVSIYATNGESVKDAVELFKAGTLQPLCGANATEHWG
ncbi:MAG: NifB/NifX family molybdenum-iron cluster-binding protein [Pirellulales bacterium]|nr:NifB/NifX family molybdenum-iron cluster-binding protein [Pirellulales bacterium]